MGNVFKVIVGSLFNIIVSVPNVVELFIYLLRFVVVSVFAYYLHTILEFLLCNYVIYSNFNDLALEPTTLCYMANSKPLSHNHPIIHLYMCTF